MVTADELKEIADLIGGLSSEMQKMQAGIARLETRMNARFDELEARFDRQEARLERHGGLLQTGSRWVNRINQWAEKIDRAFADRDRRMHEILQRLDKLEGHNGSSPAA